MAVLPHVKGTTEAIKCVLKSYYISSAVRPHTTLRKLFVHLKDEIPKDNCCGVIYEAPRKNSNKSYIGETGRQLGTRITEHRKVVEQESAMCYTSNQRKKHQRKKFKKLPLQTVHV